MAGPKLHKGWLRFCNAVRKSHRFALLNLPSGAQIPVAERASADASPERVREAKANFLQRALAAGRPQTWEEFRADRDWLRVQEWARGAKAEQIRDRLRPRAEPAVRACRQALFSVWSREEWRLARAFLVRDRELMRAVLQMRTLGTTLSEERLEPEAVEELVVRIRENAQRVKDDWEAKGQPGSYPSDRF